MKRFKKQLLAVLLSVAMLATSRVPMVFAEDNINSDKNQIQMEETLEQSEDAKSLAENQASLEEIKIDQEFKDDKKLDQDLSTGDSEYSEDLLNNDYLKLSAILKTIYGSDRYETAVKVSQDAWKDGADNVVLVNGKNTIMGIVATPLASMHKAPILLVQDNKIQDNVLNEIKRLKAKNIYIIGDREQVSKAVSDKIKKATGASMKRVFGKYPGEISANIAQQIAKERKIDTAYVVSITNGVADALSIASKAGDTQNPVIVVDKNYMNTGAKDFLKRNVSTVYYIGGEASISKALVKQVDSLVKNAGEGNRIYGSERHATNVNVINRFYKEAVLPGVVITKSENAGLIDTVSAGPYAAKYKAPIIITGKNHIAAVTMKLLEARKTDNIYQIGGGISSSVTSTIKSKLSSINKVETDKPKPDVKPQPKPQPQPRPDVDETPSSSSIRGKKIVIDAGHGGSDAGASGMYGVREKDWTLKTSLACADYLRKAGANVIMTRTSDTYPTLQDRAELSNRKGADFFCSIHYNKGGNPINPDNEEYSGTGVEVYKGEGDLAARAARNVLNSILQGFDLKNRGVKDGTHLYVIRNTDAPAILVEGGFLSNRKEISLLNNDQGLKKMGIQIAKGIIATFSK